MFAAAEQGAEDPTGRMRNLLALMAGEQRDEVSLLWLDAWQTGRRRPLLLEEVTRQMVAWRDSLAALIDDGVAGGEFHTDHPDVTAVQILTVIDGLSVRAAMRGTEIDYQNAQDLVLTTAERGLGLPHGRLHAPARRTRPRDAAVAARQDGRTAS